MNKISKFFSLFLIPWIELGAEVRLDKLIEYDQYTCADALKEADLSDLWNCFLQGQADLYFGQEAEFLANETSWMVSQNILELGSGNGAYLYRLSEMFKDKKYIGIEKQPSLVVQSNAQYGRDGLFFEEGDAEQENEQFHDQFDAVLFRLTLQHLKNPKFALQLAHKYLKQDGVVVIIDSYDPAKSSSHEISTMEDASRQHNERNKATLKGNRCITIEILDDLQNENSYLSNLYKVTRTSLDTQGNRLEKGVRFESEQDRKRYFNHALLFLSILSKGYGISVDFSKGYEELQVYVQDEKAWICPGVHFLVLKKI